MSRMFDSYDNQINCRHCSCDCIHLDMPEIMLGWSGAEIIYDQKGNEVGLGFNANSPITLKFNFSGCVIDDYGESIDVDDFINNNYIRFELLNFKHKPVLSSEFEGSVEDGEMIIKINQCAVEKLVPEIYYIRMTLLTECSDYVLFTPHDGLIHIS